MTDSVEPVDGIQRYSWKPVERSVLAVTREVERDDDGFWITYDSHVAELERVRNETHQQTIRDAIARFEQVSAACGYSGKAFQRRVVEGLERLAGEPEGSQ